MLVNMGLSYQSLPDRDGQGVPTKKNQKKPNMKQIFVSLRTWGIQWKGRKDVYIKKKNRP